MTLKQGRNQWLRYRNNFRMKAANMNPSQLAPPQPSTTLQSTSNQSIDVIEFTYVYKGTC